MNELARAAMEVLGEMAMEIGDLENEREWVPVPETWTDAVARADAAVGCAGQSTVRDLYADWDLFVRTLCAS